MKYEVAIVLLSFAVIAIVLRYMSRPKPRPAKIIPIEDVKVTFQRTAEEIINRIKNAQTKYELHCLQTEVYETEKKYIGSHDTKKFVIDMFMEIKNQWNKISPPKAIVLEF